MPCISAISSRSASQRLCTPVGVRPVLDHALSELATHRQGIATQQRDLPECGAGVLDEELSVVIALEGRRPRHDPGILGGVPDRPLLQLENLFTVTLEPGGRRENVEVRLALARELAVERSDSS
ncbi:MAG: hypothetical protein R3195_15175 [Gemmatimonadota bacterium]|nr:hypothetical protein [Gemmatimonadota bacterium]